MAVDVAVDVAVAVRQTRTDRSGAETPGKKNVEANDDLAGRIQVQGLVREKTWGKANGINIENLVNQRLRPVP